MKGYVMTALCLWMLFVLIQSQEKLQFVVQMSNMGASFPEVIEGAWVKEKGALTNIGLRQLYLLGRELRKKYIEEAKLIGDQYNPLEYIIRAPYIDRATACTSAYALARGMYVPGSGYALKREQIERAVPPTNMTDVKEFQKELRDAALLNYFASVPVMTYSGGPDYTLSASTFCENVPELISSYVSSNSSLKEKIAEKEKAYKEVIYKELSEAFNVKIDSMETALSYRDYIISAYYYAQELNIKISETGMKQLNEMYSLVQYEKHFGNMMVARVISNGVLNEMMNYINKSISDTKRAKNSNEEMSMVTYMMRDTNIIGFLRLLNYNVGNYTVNVPFASTLQFEVFMPDPNNPTDFSIRALLNGKLVYWNETKDSITTDEFFEWGKAMQIQNFGDACHGPQKAAEEVTPWIAIIIVVGGALLVLVGVLFVCFFSKKKSTPEQEDNKTLEEAKINP